MVGRKGMSWLGRKEFYSREGKNFMAGRKGILWYRERRHFIVSPSLGYKGCLQKQADYYFYGHLNQYEIG
jgi:hypothetical protein